VVRAAGTRRGPVRRDEPELVPTILPATAQPDAVVDDQVLTTRLTEVSGHDQTAVAGADDQHFDVVGQAGAISRAHQREGCAMADIGDPTSGDPTLPYHATNQTNPDVHHLYSDRPSGQRITRAHR
jgi:hypothetical protein